MSSPNTARTPWKKGSVSLALVGALAVTPALVHQKPTPDQIQMQMASFTELKPESVLQQIAARAGALAAAKANVCLFAGSVKVEECNQISGIIAHAIIPLPESTPLAAPTSVEAPPTTTTTTTTTTLPPAPSTTTTLPQPAVAPSIASLEARLSKEELALVPEIEADGVPPAPAVMLSCIAWRESNDEPTIVNSEGYAGLFQFGQATWASNGGQGTPEAAPANYQIGIAYKTYLNEGWGPWKGDICLSELPQI